MSLKLYMHPFASFCQKALVALYENGTPFEPYLVDLGNPESRANLLKVWPIGKFPVLRDEARNQTIPESSIIIEYLMQHYPGAAQLVPADADLARETRLGDRFFDLYVQQPMQKIVADRMRSADGKDRLGVEQSKATLTTAYGLIDADMKTRTWATGDNFSMADCAAAPALFYADKVLPFGETYLHVKAYLDRLMQRPSFARVIEEARPYRHLFPE